MTTGKLTLTIPGASPPIPSLEILDFDGDAGGYQRSVNGFTQYSDRSAYGTPQITGPSYSEFYIWTIGAFISEADALHLEALALWSDTTYKAGNDGALQLKDEYELLPPKPTPYGRTLITPLSPSWNAAYEYGFGQFNVKLSLPENHKVGGFASSDTAYKTIIFSMVEV